MKRQTVISGAALAYEDPSQAVPAIKEGAPGPRGTPATRAAVNPGPGNKTSKRLAGPRPPKSAPT
jgi:hypothetical protein